MKQEPLAKALEELSSPQALLLTRQALERGDDPQEIILLGLCKGMDLVGEHYSRREYFVPDMLQASKIFNEALAMVEPLLPKGRAVFARGALGMAKGNTQDNGKNIVRIMLSANGVEVVDLGKSVPVDDFLAQARLGVDFLGISVMTSAGVTQARKVVEALREAGLRDRVKVLVGGAAVDQDTAMVRIGADAYAADAAQSVAIVKKWFGQRLAS
jgi:methanogenic corrinoid protein MtbC1